MGPLHAGENKLTYEDSSVSVYAFDGLRVPDYVLNILPDEQFDFMAPQPEPLQYRDTGGVVRLLQIVNVPESRISDQDHIRFNLPIYAIDKNGVLLNELNGNFYAHLKGDRGLSASDVELVNGVGHMQVNAQISDFQAGRLNPSDIEVLPFECFNEVVGPGGDQEYCKSKPDVNPTLSNYYCSLYYDGDYVAFYEYGCASVTATSEAPTGLNQAFPPPTLFTSRIASQRIQTLVFNPAMFNRINLGADSVVRKSWTGT